jgi:predicted O-linked N-acetylglucosamine transferase (SPINDLY family)
VGVDPELANRHLILSHYDPAQDNEKLFQAHVDWVGRYAQPFSEPFDRRQSLDPERRLRIGWISPRFNAGPVASFFRGTLAAFDHERFRHVLISLGAADDAETGSFRNLSDEWLHLRALADDALLEQLRAANFDIVIDLAGHSFGNRLRVLAQRVAPIQLCWLDYFNTTGAPAIDGWISDEWLTPADSAQRYVESLYRLRCGRFCYSPSEQAPTPERIGGGAPVFVSFNRLAKLNDHVLNTWSAILHRVPTAQLELGSELLSDPTAQARTIERFAERGIGSERLRLHGARSYAGLLDAYRHTDIALDPFPFSGCTTTSDALWMGVAVVTLPGTTFVSRQSASLLWRMHRGEWVADSIDDYIERAVTMAHRVDELRASRIRLREQTRASLCNATEQATEMGALFRELWTAHCSKS